MEETTLKYLFVINPKSGGKQNIDYKDLIEKHFGGLPHQSLYFTLGGKNDAHALAAEIEQHKPQIIVAVGGDGTVSLVAKHVLNTQMQMGILPAGSANGMARELNITENLADALKILTEGVVRKADAIEVNKQICLHLSDIGLNARLIKYFEQNQIRGKIGYAKVALKALSNKKNIRVIIQSREKEIKRNAFMVVLANASKYGTGAVINPEGNLYDGVFEVVIIRKLALSEILKMVFWPRPFNPKKIEVISATSVTIETHSKVHFQVDGEYLGKVNKVVANILPGQLNLILPKES
jgi:YegS/Rv2252/BmrU family lipid kinase